MGQDLVGIYSILGRISSDTRQKKLYKEYSPALQSDNQTSINNSLYVKIYIQFLIERMIKELRPLDMLDRVDSG